MPTEIKFNGSNTQKINYTYSANGIKVRKVVNDGGSVTTTDYAGAYQYVNNNLEFIRNFEDGYVYPKSGGGFGYTYYYTDQLDNIRLSYTDADGNGTISTSEIIKEAHFYPFGLVHKGYNSTVNPIGSSFHKYDYQNQERQDELGLNWLQFKYRMQDPAIGRFVSIDPLADKYVHNSTYAFAENKVIKFNELEGLEITLNKFDRLSYENNTPDPRAKVATFVANAGISILNGAIDIFNYAGDLDRANQSGQGALNKIGSDIGDTASAISSYAQNTTLSEFGADVGNALSKVETYENIAGSIVAAGAVSKISKLGTINKSTEVVQRAMSKAELGATVETGLVRGGREGTHFVSDAVNNTSKGAQKRLALPTTPEVKATLEVPKGAFSKPTKVRSANNQPGGGMERAGSGNIPAKVIKVKEYKD